MLAMMAPALTKSSAAIDLGSVFRNNPRPHRDVWFAARGGAAGEIQLNQRLCTVIPEGVTPQQLVDVVVKFGEAHPDVTHEPFVLLTLVVINETWACKK